MNRPTLSKKQINDLVYDNKYKIDQSKKFLSHCIDGCYANEETLNPLSIAGADAGQLAILYATANVYAFEIDEKKALDTFLEIIGGPKNFFLHSTVEANSSLPAAGCAHMIHVRSDSKAYSLEKEQLDILDTQLSSLQKKGAQQSVIQADSQEAAVLQVQGEWGVYPQVHISTAQGTMPIQIYVFQKTLTDQRHRELAKKLIENKAVKLFDNLDAEYLYEVMSSVAEDHILETTTRLAKNLPIYEVIFKNDGSFVVEDRGFV